MLNTYVTVGPKSQVVIPKNVRKISNRIKPGQKVTVRAISDSSVIIEAKPSSWTKETYGMHKDIWKGIDATEYINAIRDEWKHTQRQ